MTVETVSYDFTGYEISWLVLSWLELSNDDRHPHLLTSQIVTHEHIKLPYSDEKWLNPRSLLWLCNHLGQWKCIRSASVISWIVADLGEMRWILWYQIYPRWGAEKRLYFDSSFVCLFVWCNKTRIVKSLGLHLPTALGIPRRPCVSPQTTKGHSKSKLG